MPGAVFDSGFISTIRKMPLLKKLCLIGTILIFFTNHSFSQRIKIDSLKSRLSFLKETDRIDCLNTLSLIYTYLNADSAGSYAENAYTEALSKNYVNGIAMSLNNKAHIAGAARHNYPQQEEISLQTIKTFKTLTPVVLESSYMNLALALFCESYFDRSIDACTTILKLSQNTNDQKELGEVLGVLGCINFETGDYEKSFEYFNHSLQIFKAIGDSYNTSIVMVKIGDFYRLAGDQKAASDYYYESLAYPKGPSLEWHPLEDLGNTYYALDMFDSASAASDNYLQGIKYLTVRSDYTTFPGS